jgi:hypothetical protein
VPVNGCLITTLRSFLSSVFLSSVFLSSVFLSSVFLSSVFLSSVFLSSVFLIVGRMAWSLSEEVRHVWY